MSSGTPRPPASVFSLGKAGPIEGGLLADVNHDGWLDFIRERKGSGVSQDVVFAVLGRGDGTFSGRVDIWSGNGVEAGDLNGDGLTDLAVASGDQVQHLVRDRGSQPTMESKPLVVGSTGVRLPVRGYQLLWPAANPGVRLPGSFSGHLYASVGRWGAFLARRCVPPTERVFRVFPRPG